MTPKSSFFWSTEGGSRPWTHFEENIVQTAVFLNGIELKEENIYVNERLAPLISCPAEVTKLNLNILYRNKATLQLPLPVFQEKNITVFCEKPQKIDIRLPNSVIVPKDSTLYIYPKQSFDLFLTPIPSNEK